MSGNLLSFTFATTQNWAMSSMGSYVTQRFSSLCNIVSSSFHKQPESNASLCDLPEEVCRIIVTHLVSTHPMYMDSKRQQDIIALSNTSRAFRMLCLPYIFRDVRLRFISVNDDDDVYETSRTVVRRGHMFRAERRRETGPPTMQAFFRFLDSSPHIASFVRLLTLQPSNASTSAPQAEYDPRPFLIILHKLPCLRALQLVDIWFPDLTSENRPQLELDRVPVIEHLRVSFPSTSPTHSTRGIDPSHALNAFGLFNEIGTLHLGSLRAANDTPPRPWNLRVAGVFLRSPWTILTTLAEIREAELSLSSLDVADAWRGAYRPRVLIANNPMASVTEGVALLGDVVVILRNLLRAQGSTLAHLGLGPATLAHPVFNPDRHSKTSDVKVIIREHLFKWCPNLKTLALNVLVNTLYQERSNMVLQHTLSSLEELAVSSALRPSSLRAVILSFELATPRSTNETSMHQLLVDHFNLYKDIFEHMDKVLARMTATLDVFLDIQEAAPCMLDIDAMNRYFADMLPTAWTLVRNVSETSPWAIRRRLSAA